MAKKVPTAQELLLDYPVQSYSWLINWKCGNCDKTHTKPHFAFPNQLNLKKQPGEEGRIKDDKYQREGSGKLDCDTYDDKYGTGPDTDEKTGLLNPLMCPHCGWQDHIIHVVKK